MPSSGEVIAFIAATDMNRAAVFYEDVIGLRLVAREPTALVFDSNGIILRVSQVDDHVPPGYTVVGWSVEDISRSLADLVSRGVKFEQFDMLEQDENGVCTFPNGDQVAWFRDPDGNMLSITQLMVEV
jgi:catechol 2,3-dioxygenase-like lactoylglutathione lyase family enzyme